MLPGLGAIVKAFFRFNRVVEVGRDVRRSCGPTRLVKQDHPEMVAQDRAQVAFERLRGWRLHSIPGHPVPVLGHPHCKKSVS